MTSAMITYGKGREALKCEVGPYGMCMTGGVAGLCPHGSPHRVGAARALETGETKRIRGAPYEVSDAERAVRGWRSIKKMKF